MSSSFDFSKLEAKKARFPAASQEFYLVLIAVLFFSVLIMNVFIGVICVSQLEDDQQENFRRFPEMEVPHKMEGLFHGKSYSGWLREVSRNFRKPPFSGHQMIRLSHYVSHPIIPIERIHEFVHHESSQLLTSVMSMWMIIPQALVGKWCTRTLTAWTDGMFEC